MSTFSVFVEGAVTPGDAALEALANAMAARYGLPAVELLGRMRKGRFRVKANVDRATADTYVADLISIGARAIAEDARASQPVLAATPAPASTTTPPPIAVARTTSNPQFASGLAAAFAAPADSKTDLGALGGDHVAFSLASIDGTETPTAKPASAFAPPPEPPKPGKAGAPPLPAKKKPAADDPPLDMFAPPDAGEELKVDIAEDDRNFRTSKPSIAPGVTKPPDFTIGDGSQSALIEAAPAVAARMSAPAIVTPPPAPAKKRGLFANARVRFAVGVFAAVLVGFVPAHVVGAVREKAAFKVIDDRVLATQQGAATMEAIAALDGYRDNELDAKKSARRNIALVSMLIWAAVAAGAGFAFFKLVPDPDAA